MASEVAVRYAEGLFALAKESNSVKQMREECQWLFTVQEEEPLLATFFSAIKVSAQEKKAFVDQLFSEALDETLRNYIKLLIDKSRIGILKESLSIFLRLTEEELGIQSATVYSARALPQEELNKIKQALEQQTKKEIHLQNRVDEDLIAGVKVVMGNQVTDVTMRSQIDQLKSTLLKSTGGNYERD